ncbi:MAG TPA: hypothetical protein VNI54_02190 [Thermoanaerobaculia bacterium]|nr:hypothetical protein [Thermoanaerobaculia bacterium]
MSNLWKALKRFYLFILPVRFSLLAIVVVALALLVADQGRDVMRALAEDRQTGWWLRILTLVIATNLMAYAIWFWSRHLLRYRPHAAVACDPTIGLVEQFPWWTKWLPRILGLLAFIIVIIAFPRAVGVTFRANVPALMWWIVAWLVVSAIVYWAFVVARRKIPFMAAAPQGMVTAWGSLDRTTRIVLGVSFLLEVALFLWALANPVSWWVLGVAAVLVLTIAVWIPLGSYLVAIGERYRVPILTFIVLWGVAISRCQFVDNHEVRTLGKVAQRKSLDEAFKDWHGRVSPRSAGREIPVIIVATEGGGIRAAYWTAAVMASLHDTVPGFSEHCFAISGVSGGSVGAAVYEALLVRRAEKSGVTTPMHSEARKVLEFDALSGTLAAMSQPDLLQRFVPLGFPDRAKALETGWEYGWRKAFDNENGGGDIMARPFVETMQKHPQLPLLLMNGALVESGDRIVTSNVVLHRNLHFRNAFDSLSRIQRDVRMSTGALLSARFPYVTPVGTLQAPGSGESRGRIADGGYYEVSGAATAEDLANFIWAKRAQGYNVRPFVILIDYRDVIDRKPEDARPFCPAPGECGPRWPSRLTYFATEVLSPVWALANARGARGEEAVGDLLQRMGDVQVAEFRLLPRYVPLPLGWVLSQRAQDSIDWSAACEGGNRTATHRIASLLGVTLPENWSNVTAEAARQKMNEYVPDGVPCGRNTRNPKPMCAGVGCDGQMSEGQGESR